MKINARIEGLASGLWRPDGSRGGIPLTLLTELCAIHPTGRTGKQGHAFSAYLPLDDPKTCAILEVLEKEGMRPWCFPGEKSDAEYLYSLQRIYDDADLESSKYLEFYSRYDPDISVPGEERLGTRTITLINQPGKADICMISPVSSTHVAVQRVRDALASTDLHGLQFLPVEKGYKSVEYRLDEEEDTWWELESELELPPVAPSMTLLHRDGTPFTGDFSKGCGRKDGFYFPVELHYRRSDIEQFGPFDVARTHEHFWPRGPMPRSRALVVSQRFYQVCKEHNLRTRFVPVRIDES